MTRPEIDTYDVEHNKIATLTFTSVPEADASGGIEFYVTLHDERVFSFTAYTPDQIARLMARNGWLSFVDLDTLIVREGTLEAIMHALEQVLRLDVAHFGVQVASAGAEATGDEATAP
ncbi:MAG: hypothetical protein M5R40_15885 [Anaerolineae bacterium]|nr:hypothetical protein [Anaerolineae bacterium]